MASRASPDLLPVSSPQRVSEVTDSWWHSMLILPPLLKESPASPFLAAYYPDCVGMSPSGSPGSVSLAELRADPCRAVQPQSKST
ncbi:lysine-specific histone demethylase 2-like [Menidia menidia]